MISYLTVCALAYLLGSIPFGYILVRRFRGEDIRARGSGNIGATNVARSGARGLGLLTLILDALKGLIAVSSAILIANLQPWGPAKVMTGWLPALAAISVIVGHIFPVWLHFKGGKGVATGVGAFLALTPKAVLVVLGVFVVMVIAFGYISLASIVAAAIFPAIAFFVYERYLPSITLFAMATSSLLIILKHKANIQRLLAGSENRFPWKKG